MSNLTVSNITGLNAISTSTNTATFGNSFYIVANGNVGFGVSSPATSLSLVNGGVFSWLNSAGTYNGLTAGAQFVKFTDNNLYIDNLDANSSMIFRRNGPAESLRLDASGNMLFNSGYGSAAIAYGCRAWVNFNGTGTVAIRGNGNVSSITDNGVGDYTVNFTTAMPDANYAVSGTVRFGTGGGGQAYSVNIEQAAAAIAVGSVNINTFNTSSAGLTDMDTVCMQIFR